MKLRTGIGLFALLLASFGTVSPAQAVGTRNFVLKNAKDFEGGDLTGVAVDSNGMVRAGLNLGSTAVDDANTVWAALPLKDGSVLLGTGNEGKLIKVTGGKASVLADTDTLALTSIVEAWGGRIFVGSLPDGKIFELKGDKLVEFTKLDAKHVWALAYDPTQKSLFAGTGPDGKLFRIGENGQAQVYFDSEESHLVSVASAGGRLYAGSSDHAILFTITGPGRASVLYDFGRTEVRAISVDKNGDVYAIANELETSRVGKLGATTKQAEPSSASPGKGKGTLYRFGANGDPEELYSDSKEHFTSLTLGENGQPYIGTGVEGRVYTVGADHTSLLVADTDERQIVALSVRGTTGFLASSDPVVFHPIRGIGGADAVWTSKVLDAGIRATFGRMSWDGSGTLEVSTRSGNTEDPDDTWSDWSKPVAGASQVASPAGRYLQVRARFSRDQNAVLRQLVVPFLTDNLRAVLTQIDSSSGADLSGSTGIAKSGGPVTEKADAKIKLSWKIDNPDEDEMRYRVQYRLLGADTWFDLLEPQEILTSESYSWETADVPEGRYRVRVLASDELSNPPDRVKRHELESNLVLVDNTAPSIEQLRVEGRRVRGVALDGIGPIQRIEATVVGSGEWVPFFPVDGVFDEQREEFDFDVSPLAPRGPALLTIRVYDSANNATLEHVRLQ